MQLDASIGSSIGMNPAEASPGHDTGGQSTDDSETTAVKNATLVSGLVTVEAVLVDRMGLLVASQETAPGMDVVSDDQVCKLLLHNKETLPPALECAAQALMSYLLRPQKSFVIPPSSLIDTGHGNQSILPVNRRQDIVVSIAVEREGGEWYFIRPAQGSPINCDYHLAVSDPLTVNHIFRTNVAPTVYEMTRLLLKWGAPFKTFKRVWHRSSLLPVSPMPMFFNHVPLGLGIVSHNHEFTLADYDVYVNEREELLSSFQGRAALLSGGLLWRIARDSLREDADVCNGTSGFHTAYDCVELNEGTYAGDKLTAHQQDVICGVYRVEPGRQSTAT
jgi:hypothetical protein